MNAKVIVGIIIGVITITSIVFALSYTSTEESTGVEDNSEISDSLETITDTEAEEVTGVGDKSEISDSLETITDTEAEEEKHFTLELNDTVATIAKP